MIFGLLNLAIKNDDEFEMKIIQHFFLTITTTNKTQSI